MNESHMRQLVVKLLKPLHAFSVENPCHPGTPDINYTVGWIELKATDDWPVRAGTIVKLDHDLTKQQRIWHVKRQAAGGRTFVLLSIAKDWLLFDGATAAKVLGLVSKLELYAHARAAWAHVPPYEDMKWFLLYDNQS